MMGWNRFTVQSWFAFGLVALVGCADDSPTGSRAPAPAVEPGMARIWFLRQSNPPSREIEAAKPMVFANGAPVAETKEGTAFFHDFPPGTYKLTVQAFGTPAGRGDTVQLAPGTQSYVQVIGEANWEQGSSVGGWSFAVQSMAPEIAQQYLPTMTNLGRR